MKGGSKIQDASSFLLWRVSSHFQFHTYSTITFHCAPIQLQRDPCTTTLHPLLYADQIIATEAADITKTTTLIPIYFCCHPFKDLRYSGGQLWDFNRSSFRFDCGPCFCLQICIMDLWKLCTPHPIVVASLLLITCPITSAYHGSQGYYDL